jgi:hypothetical protein
MYAYFGAATPSLSARRGVRDDALSSMLRIVGCVSR